MPKFVVTQEETSYVRYLVEADDIEAAREKFLDAEGDTIELGSELQDAEVANVAPYIEVV